MRHAGLETELGPALRRIGAAGTLENAGDRRLVMDFLSWVAVHNPRHRETIRKFHEDVSTRVLDLASATPERWAGQMRKAREAGLVARTGHGLRKSRAIAIVEAGGTPHQVGAWTGHTSLKEIEHYAKDFDRKRVLTRTKTDAEVPTSRTEFQETSKKEAASNG